MDFLAVVVAKDYWHFNVSHRLSPDGLGFKGLGFNIIGGHGHQFCVLYSILQTFSLGF